MLALLCLTFVAGAAAAPTSCNQMCMDLYSPVCGSDGRTYSNTCYMGIASCQNQQQGRSHIYKVHSGSCISGSLLGGGSIGSSACDEICDEVRSPLCASDGVVYENRCLYTKAKCEAQKNGTRLSIVSYTSTCPTPTEPNCQKYAVNTSDLAIEGQPAGGSIKLVCPQSSHEVCSNHGTFRSECELCKTVDSLISRYQHISGYPAPDYKILFDGPCHTTSSYINGYPSGSYYPGGGIPIDPGFGGGVIGL